jgi:hypothetical protein
VIVLCIVYFLSINFVLMGYSLAYLWAMLPFYVCEFFLEFTDMYMCDGTNLMEWKMISMFLMV